MGSFKPDSMFICTRSYLQSSCRAVCFSIWPHDTLTSLRPQSLNSNLHTVALPTNKPSLASLSKSICSMRNRSNKVLLFYRFVFCREWPWRKISLLLSFPTHLLPLLFPLLLPLMAQMVASILAAFEFCSQQLTIQYTQAVGCCLSA